jgi:hypothetical protein
MSGAVVEPEHRRTTERSSAEVAHVQIDAAVAIHVGRGRRVGEVMELRDVRGRVHELSVRCREGERVVEAGRIRRRFGSAVGVVDVGATVVVEVSDYEPAAALRPRNRPLEQLTAAVDEPTVTFVDRKLHSERRSGSAVRGRVNDIGKTVAVEVGRSDRVRHIHRSELLRPAHRTRPTVSRQPRRRTSRPPAPVGTRRRRADRSGKRGRHGGQSEHAHGRHHAVSPPTAPRIALTAIRHRSWLPARVKMTPFQSICPLPVEVMVMSNGGGMEPGESLKQ